MSEVDDVVSQGAKSPIRPKKMPKLVEGVRQKPSKTAKDRAVELIEEAFRGESITGAALMKKVPYMPQRALFEAFRNFEAALGGRAKLIEALQHCPPNSNGAAMVGKLLNDEDFLAYAQAKGDTENVRFSLAHICLRHSIPLNAVVTAFKDAKTAQIAIQTLTTLADATPQVIQQLAEDSTNRYEQCTVCEGTKTIWRISADGEWALSPEGDHLTQLCHHCRGTGKIFKEHDVQNRKTFLQLTGLLDTSKPLVQQTFNQNAQMFRGDFLPGDGAFEKLIKAVDATTIKPLVAEVVDVPFTMYEEGSVTVVTEKEEEKPSPDPE